ncbi:hypothetical protein GLOTRDRAFT_138596 [Gloeophyllum trabeum ATCC 11539]|uniref:polynucleotide adenylyltransferase n=1 Tax=Gloeophyllum trabeum (strain ATCC 11539 / FP-39264 / Madison 617) TaxID=670483 RepID=S7RS30_GLOTA|nr:uncharacterized protein GLOTRDRAFT_138596 [Gloeophyllum trabeum ATCC 11539]EPQ55829.1 hypothetical protein GLOTRDRAFT_138596 [Gloeophyllum trabeum ATCC 11539]
MATYTQPLGRSHSMHQQFSVSHPPTSQRKQASRQRFVTEFSQCLFDFVVQLLPTQEELAVKEDVRKLLERLIRTIEPDSRLLSFGSTANGFSLRNSDMDLCCLIDSEDRLSATDMVTMLGDLLERETKFHVKPLPHARIPIVKLSLDPSPGLPLGIACDIGFENRLALENTRLLMCYAMIDPTRVRSMVLFLKVWAKRRKINSPYKGTLSSYGYVLLVLYFLIHVKNPPVLPNLQQIPPLRPISEEETHLQGHNIWFFDDIQLLRQRWQSANTENVAELLIDFFRYYSRDFPYSVGVASIKNGLLTKDSKGWQSDLDSPRYNDLRERNRFCIEDPFETDFNVARCVTKEGLYTIRGEFMRASRILASRPERAIVALAQLCEERPDEQLGRPLPARSAFVPPRLSPVPPQSPYTIGSNPLRPNRLSVVEKLAPQTQVLPVNVEQQPPPPVLQVPPSPPPDHMAPKRSKWTSPPPPEAPPSVHASFEDQFGKGLELATASSEAREEQTGSYSSNNSEVPTDDEVPTDGLDSDDVRSVHSFTEESLPSYREPGPSSLGRHPRSRYKDEGPALPRRMTAQDTAARQLQAALRMRGRMSAKQASPLLSPSGFTRPPPGAFSPIRSESSRRSSSGPPRIADKALLSHVQSRIPTTISSSPAPRPIIIPPQQASNVFYQTSPAQERATYLYPNPGSCTSLYSQYQAQQHYYTDASSPNTGHRPSTQLAPERNSPAFETPDRSPTLSQMAHEGAPSTGHRLSMHIAPKIIAPDFDTPDRSPTLSQMAHEGEISPTYSRFSHAHSHSSATITPRVFHFARSQTHADDGHSSSPEPPSRPPSRRSGGRAEAGSASSPVSVSTPSVSPTSSVSSHYPVSVSPSSTSPPSPHHSPRFHDSSPRIGRPEQSPRPKQREDALISDSMKRREAKVTDSLRDLSLKAS